MTALQEYQRLESTGLWRDMPGAQRREVAIAFGDATLVISDTKSNRALAHWSLPAVERLNPGEVPARYAPGPDAGEELEIEDELMVRAIAKVHRIIEARKPHPGRLRLAILGGTLTAVLWLGIFWVPDALIRHTAKVVPLAKRQQIGGIVLDDVIRLTGQPCSTREGSRSLALLASRLSGQGVRSLYVMPAALRDARHLPGGAILLGRDLVEDHETPDVVAGFVLAERARAAAQDPLRDLLDWAGYRASFRLLTTGQMPAETIAGYAEHLLNTPPEPVADDRILPMFGAVGFSSAPYAYALDPTGETTIRLIEADPLRDAPPQAIIEDGDWVALQGICGA